MTDERGVGRVIAPLRPPDSYACESCGQVADVRLDDSSTWCLACNDSANNLGYDQHRGRWLPGRKKANGGRR